MISMTAKSSATMTPKYRKFQNKNRGYKSRRIKFRNKRQDSIDNLYFLRGDALSYSIDKYLLSRPHTEYAHAPCPHEHAHLQPYVHSHVLIQTYINYQI